ncbi:MAG TPA: DUF411 domain-containing protein [Mesorhizobium sp.]|uniref:DUF411 domain-containing protein n=1 Tax=Mesorhizobium sp. TaxID=1871066 RepID=UPI002DDD6D53|nr:DUF411 domain-containing protein [Mesorhizobium sp.]HEV2506903.1 DUF411 domain-containing protein [Mesorhizobium sp.]
MHAKSCGCCGAWADHIAKAGFPVKIVESSTLETFKTEQGVLAALQSCNTALVDGYVLEGHVSAEAVSKLLKERPSIKGLAVAGMPAGSPGMEMSGVAPEAYDVMTFGSAGTVFMRFDGS